MPDTSSFDDRVHLRQINDNTTMHWYRSTAHPDLPPAAVTGMTASWQTDITSGDLLVDVG